MGAAITHLKQAVAKDPKFARAWETLGAVLVPWNYWGVGEEGDFQAGADASIRHCVWIQIFR